VKYPPQEGCYKWWPCQDPSGALGNVATLIEELDIVGIEIIEKWKIPQMKKQRAGTSRFKRGDLVWIELHGNKINGVVFSTSENLVTIITKTGRKLEVLEKNVKREGYETSV
jgi:hypothetical protein